MIPKFRAWNKKRQKMIHSDDIIVIDLEDEHITIKEDTYTTVQYITHNGYFYPERDLVKYEFDEVIFMQSTKLMDEKHQCIFEGDIIKASREADGNINVHVGVVKQYCGRWVIDINTDVIDLWANGVNDTNEIIGNMYENPNLI